MNRFMQSASPRVLLYFIRGWRVFTQARPKAGVPDDYPIFALADLRATGSTTSPIRRPLRATDRRRATGYSFFWRREILHLIELPDFDVGALGHGVGCTLHPANRFLQRLALPNPVAGYQFRCVGEGTHANHAVLPGERHTSPLRRRLQPSSVVHDARGDEFLVVLAHGLDQFLARHRAGLGCLGGLYEDHESHGRCSFLCVAFRVEFPNRQPSSLLSDLRLDE